MNNQAVYQRSTISYLLLAALMAAVCAVCSWISIPLPFTPVPINLGTLAVFLAAGILGWKYGTISVIVFVLLGAAGLPVFHGSRRLLDQLRIRRPGALCGILRQAADDRDLR